MRRDLIDDARSRSGLFNLTGREEITAAKPDTDLAIQIDRLMGELSRQHPHLPQVVELKYFLGLADDECAEILNLQPRTLARQWQDARWWLFRRLAQVPEGPAW